MVQRGKKDKVHQELCLKKVAPHLHKGKGLNRYSSASKNATMKKLADFKSQKILFSIAICVDLIIPTVLDLS